MKKIKFTKNLMIILPVAIVMVFTGCVDAAVQKKNEVTSAVNGVRSITNTAKGFASMKEDGTIMKCVSKTNANNFTYTNFEDYRSEVEKPDGSRVIFLWAGDSVYSWNSNELKGATSLKECTGGGALVLQAMGDEEIKADPNAVQNVTESANFTCDFVPNDDYLDVPADIIFEDYCKLYMDGMVKAGEGLSKEYGLDK